MITFMLVILGICLLCAVPIFVSLGISCFGSLVPTTIDPVIIVQRYFSGIDKFALMALPFFIISANFMDSGGLSKRILAMARALVGHITGGMALTTQLACMFFGALSGSAPATVVAIGKTMYPELEKAKYDKSFISGLLSSAGSVALIIPPGVTLIIYATVTGASVSDLFMAGIGAGIVYGLVSMIYIYFYSKKHHIAKEKKVSRHELWVALKDSWAALLVPVIILGGIYSGIFTPTEAAGVSVIYAFIIGKFVYKELTWKKAFETCKRSAVTCGQVLMLTAAAQALGWVLTVGQVPQVVTTSLLANLKSPALFLLLLNFILLIMGMFIEGTAAIIIIAPLILSVAQALGVDMVHLGIIMVSNLAIGMFTPPFGMNIFVTSSITKQGMAEMLPGLMRFLLVDLIALAIITYIPQVSLFLPSLLK